MTTMDGDEDNINEEDLGPLFNAWLKYRDGPKVGKRGPKVWLSLEDMILLYVGISRMPKSYEDILDFAEKAIRALRIPASNITTTLQAEVRKALSLLVGRGALARLDDNYYVATGERGGLSEHKLTAYMINEIKKFAITRKESKQTYAHQELQEVTKLAQELSLSPYETYTLLFIISKLYKAAPRCSAPLGMEELREGTARLAQSSSYTTGTPGTSPDLMYAHADDALRDLARKGLVVLRRYNGVTKVLVPYWLRERVGLPPCKRKASGRANSANTSHNLSHR